MNPGKHLAVVTCAFILFFAALLVMVLNPGHWRWLYRFRPEFDPGQLSGNVLVLTGNIADYNTYIPEGALVVQDGSIIWRGPACALKPGNYPAVHTDCFLYPGLIDSHNHPSYNILPPWRPDRKFDNRYEWARTSEYDDITNPRRRFMASSRGKVLINRYAEIKALIAGTTMIQGMRKLRGISSLVRNLDSYNGCKEDRISTSIHPMQPREIKRAADIISKMDRGETTHHIIHLGEGIDDESRNELDRIGEIGLIRDGTVVIHGTAFSENEFRRMKDSGMNLIWSPMSNHICYGDYTRADLAHKCGLLVALAPDWSLTGSDNLIDELKFARKISRDEFDGYFSDLDLFSMVTIIPARICGFDDKLGSLEPGKEADIIAVSAKTKDPYENLFSIDLSDIRLVTIKGVPYYGDPELLQKLGKAGDFETLEVMDSIKAIDVTDEAAGSIPLGDVRLYDMVGEIQKAFPDLHPFARGVNFPEHPLASHTEQN